jgi:cobalt-precorrin-5B (C1)-methyltransferase
MTEKTGIEEYYAIKNGKKLRFGYTTGTCAAAATKAAAIMLASGKIPERVSIMTPKGIELSLEVLEPVLDEGKASCAIKKFSGDDPDATAGVMVYSCVSWSKEPGVHVDGGLGVGRVTKPGLKQAVGEPAINPVPMDMIKRAAEEAVSDCGTAEGLNVVISIPEGVEIAKHTFNPRLGIEGGISVLGTSGIVEPMSMQAIKDTIRVELRQQISLGHRAIAIAPGNYGLDFMRERYGFDLDREVKCSNFIGDTIDIAAELGVEKLLFIGHIGKLIKVSGGIMNTHSREADSRMELMAAHAIKTGCDIETAGAILSSLTTSEAYSHIKAAGLESGFSEVLMERIAYHLGKRAAGRLEIQAIVFSNEDGLLGETEGAAAMLELIGNI